ncbi:fused response regulator/phosphatase [Marinobacter sp. X15-166B]|nr:fused response regulator/phosphatase [Marinobacter sp. X15-166B]
MDQDLPEKHPLRILIADDNDVDRLILKSLVRRLGHRVYQAVSGAEAVDRYRQHRPDIVLLDVMMPVMDGLEAARQIKALAGEQMVPVIFLTSLSEADALARCLEAGGDDFLPKPYNRVIIEAKIKAFNRMRQMHETLSRQRDVIHAHNQQLLAEQRLARKVFDNIAHTGCLDAPHIMYRASPLSVFSGDLLLACPRPSGGLHIFIGDFTGYGLPAAVGALPIAEMFYGMTSKGFDLGEILREINQKLNRILPTGMFCCACLVQANFHQGELRIWNGGLPDGYLLRPNGEFQLVRSAHLPLGVLDADRFSTDVVIIKTDPGDVLLMATDGVVEATNRDGEMYGEARLQAALGPHTGAAAVFEALQEGLQAFTGDQQMQDDATLVVLEMVSGSLLPAVSAQLVLEARNGPMHWESSYKIEGPTLSSFNPLPLLLHICLEVPGLRHRSSDVYTLLSELYANALEHGVLELSSAWKNSPEGFSRYYAERERRLKNIHGHFIRFHFRHTATDTGGKLVIACEDSGKGFDVQQYLNNGHGRTPYAGRGLALIQGLSESVRFHAQGNHIEVVYHWRLP